MTKLGQGVEVRAHYPMHTTEQGGRGSEQSEGEGDVMRATEGKVCRTKGKKKYAEQKGS